MADKENIKEVRQVFASAHKNAHWRYDYLVLAVDLPDGHLNWLREHGILVYKCPSLNNFSSLHAKKIPTTLYRIWLFDVFFKNWEYVVYVDADVIIEHSIENLLQHNGLLAVQDSNNRTVDWQLRGGVQLDKQARIQYRNLTRLLDVQAPSFNAGVLSIHTQQIEEDTVSNLIEMLSENYDVFASHMWDQALFNVFFYNHWINAPRIFNVYVNYAHSNYRKPYPQGVILHFAGSPKPWSTASVWNKDWHKNYNFFKMIPITTNTASALFDEKFLAHESAQLIQPIRPIKKRLPFSLVRFLARRRYISAVSTS